MLFLSSRSATVLFILKFSVFFPPVISVNVAQLEKTIDKLLLLPWNSQDLATLDENIFKLYHCLMKKYLRFEIIFSGALKVYPHNTVILKYDCTQFNWILVCIVYP